MKWSWRHTDYRPRSPFATMCRARRRIVRGIARCELPSLARTTGAAIAACHGPGVRQAAHFPLRQTQIFCAFDASAR
eukprot:scaffold15577_cov35-Tisochrysis_lutea.AAC.4